MNDHFRARARFLVILGFTVNIVAASLDLVNVYRDGTYQYLFFSGTLEIWLSLFLALSATGTWWYLTMLTAENTVQRRLLEKAMYWFATQVVLGVVASLSAGWHQSITTWNGSIIWIMVVGGVLEGIGLIALARLYAVTTFTQSETSVTSNI